MDPHRPGHELNYPGEVCLRMADVAVINKIDSASKEGIDTVKANIKKLILKLKLLWLIQK